MNLTKCEDCGYEITVKSDVCLNCGERIYKKKSSGFRGFLRRIIFLIIAIYILLTALKIIN